MKTSEHTPGPWGVSPRPGKATAAIDAPDRGWWRLAKVYVELAGSPSEEGEANARLIAAAPDLLAVAKAYEEWEAAMIMCQKAWAGGRAEFPTLTAELWDRLLEIQAMRNAAVRKAVSGG